MKWSYKTVHFELKKEGLLGGSFLDEAEIEEQLNDFGKAGWELTAVIEVQDGVIAFFKQPLGETIFSVAGTDSEADSIAGDEVYEPYEADDIEEPDEPHGEEMYVAEEEATAEYDDYENHDANPEQDEFSYRDGEAELDGGEVEENFTYVEENQPQEDNHEEYDEEEEQPDQKGIGAIRIE